MEKLQSDKYTVFIIPPTTSYRPVDGRKYTFIKKENETSLTIGTNYSIGLDNSGYEEVFIAEWMPKLGEYVLWGKMSNNEENPDELQSNLSDRLSDILNKIIQADHELFKHAPWLLDAPIFIQFDSYFPQFRTVKNIGTPRSFLTNHLKDM